MTIYQEQAVVMKAVILGTADYHATMQQVAQHNLHRLIAQMDKVATRRSQIEMTSTHY